MSEWKSALEKSLVDAARSPLPVEVFKVTNNLHYKTIIYVNVSRLILIT